MRFNRRSPCLVLTALVLLLLPAAAMAQVSVYAEGAYNNTLLHVYIYADIQGSPLCSFGVALNYNPSTLTMATATTNANVWYFGDPPPDNLACPNCVTSTSGSIVFVGGKLATASPSAGVGPLNRVLLAKATFNRTGDTSFGLTLGLGKTAPTSPNFDNFVTTSGTPVDSGVSFAVPIIARAGDADRNGVINSLDGGAIRNIFFSGGSYSVFADCDLNGVINSLDGGCVRNIFFGVP
jgi:hypothetical protein